MKKMIVTALAASLILSLAGCGSKGAETEKTTAAAGETKSRSGGSRYRSHRRYFSNGYQCGVSSI